MEETEVITAAARSGGVARLAAALHLVAEARDEVRLVVAVVVEEEVDQGASSLASPLTMGIVPWGTGAATHTAELLLPTSSSSFVMLSKQETVHTVTGVASLTMEHHPQTQAS